MKVNAYGASLIDLSPSLTTSGDDTTPRGTADYNMQQISSEDTTSLTSGVASVQALTDAAFDTTARTTRIASLQQVFQSGQYTVDPAAIAAALSKAVV